MVCACVWGVWVRACVCVCVRARARWTMQLHSLYRVVSPALSVHDTVIVTVPVPPAVRCRALHWACLCAVSHWRGRRRERLGRGGLTATSSRAPSRSLGCSRFPRGDVARVRGADSRPVEAEEHTEDEQTTPHPATTGQSTYEPQN